MNEVKRLHVLLLCGLVGLLSACHARHLVFTTYTKAGIDITVADGTPTQAVFGYKRFEGAVIPVDVTRDTAASKDGTEPGTESDPEAMSVYAAMDLENGWLSGLKITQVFATGQAAKDAANNPSGFSRLVKEVRGGQDSAPNEDQNEGQNGDEVTPQ